MNLYIKSVFLLHSYVRYFVWYSQWFIITMNSGDQMNDDLLQLAIKLSQIPDLPKEPTNFTDTDSDFDYALKLSKQLNGSHEATNDIDLDFKYALELSKDLNCYSDNSSLAECDTSSSDSKSSGMYELPTTPTNFSLLKHSATKDINSNELYKNDQGLANCQIQFEEDRISAKRKGKRKLKLSIKRKRKRALPLLKKSKDKNLRNRLKESSDVPEIFNKFSSRTSSESQMDQDYLSLLISKPGTEEELEHKSTSKKSLQRRDTSNNSDMLNYSCSSASVTDPSCKLLDTDQNMQALFVTLDNCYFEGELTDKVEVKLSSRMTRNISAFKHLTTSGIFLITLNKSFLLHLPRKDLVDILLHEMIHAYLFITKNIKNRNDHGFEFQKHASRINCLAGSNIGLSHEYSSNMWSSKQVVSSITTSSAKNLGCTKLPSALMEFFQTQGLKMSAFISSHSLMAFDELMKLSYYADLLNRDKEEVFYLLRRIFNGEDEADFNRTFCRDKLSTSNNLPTLPFRLLRYLFKSTPLTSISGKELRVAALTHGTIDFVLLSLAKFTHESYSLPSNYTSNQDMGLPNSNNKKKSEIREYWAKGTGYGTGNTRRSWNVKETFDKQRFEEAHVIVFFQILVCYINPQFQLEDESNEHSYIVEEDPIQSELSSLPPLFIIRVEQSCLIPAIAYYLRNDSVLDISKHIPLYRTILLLIRVMARHPQMVKFLLPSHCATRPNSSSSSSTLVDKVQTISVLKLLQGMKTCVEMYSSRLKYNKLVVQVGTSCEEEDENEENLIGLIPDIQTIIKVVEENTVKLISKNTSLVTTPLPKLQINSASVEEVYLRVMKTLQFDMYDMIVEVGDGLDYKFQVSHHFENRVRSSTTFQRPARMKRLAQESATLATSLPLSYSSSVFVRCDTERLDLMKVLITGPVGTPYANGCFEFDVYFPHDYPQSPMHINLQTTGRQTVRFNPNLYNEGKVCLSILNTWEGRPEERWNPQTSSLLQVLVSIQSLILVPDPYFNEPGFEKSRGTVEGDRSSKAYNSNIIEATVRWAMLEQICNPSPCFKEIIHTHFWLKKDEIMKEIENSISKMNQGKNLRSLRKNFHGLCDELKKLELPNNVREYTQDLEVSYKPSIPTVSETLTVISTSLSSVVNDQSVTSLKDSFEEFCSNLKGIHSQHCLSGLSSSSESMSLTSSLSRSAKTLNKSIETDSDFEYAMNLSQHLNGDDVSLADLDPPTQISVESHNMSNSSSYGIDNSNSTSLKLCEYPGSISTPGWCPSSSTSTLNTLNGLDAKNTLNGCALFNAPETGSYSKLLRNSHDSSQLLSPPSCSTSSTQSMPNGHSQWNGTIKLPKGSVHSSNLSANSSCTCAMWHPPLHSSWTMNSNISTQTTSNTYNQWIHDQAVSSTSSNMPCTRSHSRRCNSNEFVNPTSTQTIPNSVLLTGNAQSRFFNFPNTPPSTTTSMSIQSANVDIIECDH